MNLENNNELSNYITKYYNQIDNIYIDKFWSSINNKDWIYVDDLLIEWIGYKKDNGKFKYTNLIKENFKENSDYKIYNYDEINKIFHSPLKENENNTEILKFKDVLKDIHNRTLHLILSPKCFKKSLMMIRTEKANKIRDYYIDIEEICLEFNKFLLENKQSELEEKENIINEQKEEIKNVKEKIVDLSNNLFKYQELNKNSYLYVATNKHLGLQNNFKIGVSTQLTKRLINYNCNNNKNDSFYYTYVRKMHNAYTVEYMIKHILKQFRNAHNNEIYVINRDVLVSLLDNIINNYDNTIEYYNLVMKNYTTTNVKIQPPAIDISNFEKVNNHNQEPDKSNELYYNDNQEFKYCKYKNENNKNVFKCLRCEYVFNRIDNLQNHFNRQIKCFENAENSELQEIINNNDNPIIKQLNESDRYTYYEKYNPELNNIQYYCNNCDYSTDNLNVLKNHYLKRKIKCYEQQNEEITELQYTLISTNEVFKYSKIESDKFKCNYCDYIGSKSNMIRHFNKKITCKQTLDSKILKETDNTKYFVIYKNKIKSFQCYHCDFTTLHQHCISRHQNDSLNKCH